LLDKGKENVQLPQPKEKEADEQQDLVPSQEKE
jgi:hypothetical protein